MKTTKQMFGKLQRQLDADDRFLREEAVERARRAAEEEARLEAPLTRREMIDALEEVACDYGGNGNHDSDLIADAFRKLAKALS